MAFLTRVANTREGAERLLDGQLLVRLAHCSFLDSGSVPIDGMSAQLPFN